MKVDTPVATMGIRGTTPRVEISDDGSVKFSTLIEEGKSKLAKKPGSATAQQPEQKAQPKFNLNICRGARSFLGASRSHTSHWAHQRHSQKSFPNFQNQEA
jgi:hypothetical protein